MILYFRFQIDLEDLQVEFERINGQVAVAEKKLKTFDKASFDFFIKKIVLESDVFLYKKLTGCWRMEDEVRGPCC